MLSFSPNLKEKYWNKNNIVIEIINRWCDGKSINIQEVMPDNKDNLTIIQHNLWEHISVWIKTDDINKITWWFISLVNDKYIFSNKDQILTRCGCWKSFSFKTGNEMQDKIQILRKKLKKSKACV